MISGPATIVLVRHAEPAGGADPGLAPAGRKRAELLAFMFQDAHITAVFTSDLRRTKETAQPLAAKFSLVPGVLSGLDPVAHSNRVLAISSGVAVVVGHTNTVPQLIAALGVRESVQIAETEFDRMFVVSRREDGASVLSLRYRL